MTCREIVDFIRDYLDGELPEPQRVAFENHLTSCSDCVEYLRTYEQSVALGRAALKAEDENSVEFPSELITAVLESLRADRRQA